MRRRAWVLAAALAVPPAWADGPPRLAGTVVTRESRVALFDGGAGATISAVEGEQIDGYAVVAIAPGAVRLERDGTSSVVLAGPAYEKPPPVDTGGVTFGLVLRAQPPVDD